ncbi:phage DNA ejection protein [Xenorhabdus bovienii]|uniref:phage DNA ejection protein n=1 Tax=Xenorhabdus bovienii TaxID=40576 RepID=UPI00237CD8F3|nr:phage DNA ejection protein [Xenorhabdus bovienii]MDE1492348.1 DNA transfer protein [Xenorhabdus bovienii]
MVQPINYYESLMPDLAGQALKETQNRLGQSQLTGLNLQNQQMQQQMSEQQVKQQQLQQFQQEWGNSYGDPLKMQALAGKYPAQMEMIQKAIGFQDDNHRMALGNAARDLRIALQSGNPQAVAQAAQVHERTLNTVGSGTKDIMQGFQNNPQGLMQTVDAVGMGALGVDKYYDIQDKKEGREIRRGELAESIRNNDMTNARGIRGQDIGRANALTSAYAPTSAMQNYQQYANMLKADPEGAKTFAQAAGINPSEKKLFKVETMPDGSVMKYYSNGEEEKGKITDPIKDANMRKPLSVREADGILQKASEGSKSAAGFAMRIEDGLSGMDQLMKSSQISPQRAAFISARLGDGMIANTALSPSEQAYLLHARDTVNAILRKDTGAAITDAETKEYGRLYLPQPGESNKALDVKNKKLAARFKTFRGESGLAYEAMKVSSKAYDAQEQAGKPIADTPQSSSSGGVSEGATATNPQTGKKIIFRGGQWQPI